MENWREQQIIHTERRIAALEYRVAETRRVVGC
jgi:hypothetical protein